MRSYRPADVQSLPNLLFNGALDCLEPQSHGTPLPHFWSFSGLSPRTLAKGEVSSYDVVEGETIAKKGELRDYLRLFLLNNSQVTISQSFLATQPLDFPVPLGPGTARREVDAGFLSPYERVMSRSREYSFGVSMRVRRGVTDLRVRLLDIFGNIIAEEPMASAVDARKTSQRWWRYTATLAPSAVPAQAVFVFQRVSGSELVEAHVGFFQMVLGAYDLVPYTGDPSLGAIPKDAVIMVMGDVCPPGYTLLEEPDDVEVPEDWTEVDEDAKVRQGSFPIGEDGGDRVEGGPTHNRESFQFKLARNDVVAFESFDSLLGSVSSYYNANVNSPADEPTEDGRADHQHNVVEAGSIPVNRQFRFCRRI